MELTKQDHNDIDAFWATKQKPRTPIRPDQYFGAITVSITCRACGKRAQQTTSDSALLCATCRKHLDRTEATIQGKIEAFQAAITQERDRWVDEQAAVDDATADRWTRLIQDWQRVTRQLREAETGPYRNQTSDQIAATITERREAYNLVIQRIARTQERGGAIAELLNAQETHNKTLWQLQDQLREAQQALSEIDAARPGGAPF